MATEGFFSNHALESIKRRLTLIFSHLSELSLLEFRMAVRHFIVMIALGVAILFLLFTFWLLALAVFACFLNQHNLPFYAILAILGVLQVILVIPILLVMRSLGRGLFFPKTREALDIIIHS